MSRVMLKYSLVGALMVWQLAGTFYPNNYSSLSSLLGNTAGTASNAISIAKANINNTEASSRLVLPQEKVDQIAQLNLQLKTLQEENEASAQEFKKLRLNLELELAQSKDLLRVRLAHTPMPIPVPTQIPMTTSFQKPSTSYEPWLLCSGCYQQDSHSNTQDDKKVIRCGDLIRLEQNKEELQQDLGTAATTIAKRYPSHCGRCNPNSCGDKEKLYWRIDEAAPTELQAWTLPIPKSVQEAGMNFPKEGVEDPKAFFDNPQNRVNETANKLYFWLYNPTMVALKTARNDTVPITLFKEEQSPPVYFSTQRASVIHSAFGLHRDKFVGTSMGTQPHNWQKHEGTIFSFLREDLSVIEDGFFRIQYADFRLFVLNEQIYLGHGTLLGALHIAKADPTVTTKWKVVNGKNVKVFRDIYDNDNVSNNNKTKRSFEIHLEHLDQDLLTCMNGCEGKNYNYFTTKDGTIWAQTNPVGPSKIQKVLPKDKRTWAQKMDASDSSYNHRDLPRLSFGTSDEPYLASKNVSEQSVITPHRGTALLSVPMVHPKTGQQILVGISHRKGANYQYISNLYAILAERPFSVVAMSGQFCLGHPSSREFTSNHLATLTRNHNASLGTELDCPRITFISSMLENPSNSDTILIGYGLNDALSRYIEVSKSDILQLLFDPMARINGS